MITSKGSCWHRMIRLLGRACVVITISHFSFLIPNSLSAQTLNMVELNCENLFDYTHDEGKDDMEYLPEATRHWTKKRYWRKLNNIAQELLSCSDNGIPDLIALCEIENDSVLQDLTKRSLLRNAGYEYLITASPDVRGIDVALLYSPLRLRRFAVILFESHRLKTCVLLVISSMFVVRQPVATRSTSSSSICPAAMVANAIAGPSVK